MKQNFSLEAQSTHETIRSLDGNNRGVAGPGTQPSVFWRGGWVPGRLKPAARDGEVFPVPRALVMAPKNAGPSDAHLQLIQNETHPDSGGVKTFWNHLRCSRRSVYGRQEPQYEVCRCIHTCVFPNESELHHCSLYAWERTGNWILRYKLLHWMIRHEHCENNGLSITEHVCFGSCPCISQFRSECQSFLQCTIGAFLNEN